LDDDAVFGDAWDLEPVEGWGVEFDEFAFGRGGEEVGVVLALLGEGVGHVGS
jgi:hypothetical protein